MRCAACKNPMVVLELGGVEVDHCLQCGSIWLDGGELEILFGAQQGNDAFFNSLKPADGSGSRAPKRKCPVCGTWLRTLAAPDGTVIDRCPKDNGFWFDHGELLSVLRAAPSLPHSEVASLLTEMFARQSQQKGGKA